MRPELQLDAPSSLAIDATNRIVIADVGHSRIRRVDVNGVITTVAGNGTRTLSEDGVLASTAALVFAAGVAVDGLGRVLIADQGSLLVRRIELDGTLKTIAGSGRRGASGDGGLAINADLGSAANLAVDSLGRIWISDTSNSRIRRVELDGRIVTVAGTGQFGFSGDGGNATSAQIQLALKPAFDELGRIVFVDRDADRIRRIEADGTLTTVAGSGIRGFSGDGGPATGAALSEPSTMAIDNDGRIAIADASRVRIVDVDGTISTLAGTGVAGSAGDNGPASAAQVSPSGGVAFDAIGRVVIAEFTRIRRVDLDGIITTIAGVGSRGFTGDGGPAVNAQVRLSGGGIAVDGRGRILLADTGNNRVRRIDEVGIITTVAGSDVLGFFGDDGPATSARLHSPTDVAVDSQDRIYVLDATNLRIRRIDVDGTIRTVAGTGIPGLAGDGGLAKSASTTPERLAVDGAGVILIADPRTQRIRRVDLDGIITTVAGPAHPQGPGHLIASQLYPSRAIIAVDNDVISVGDFGRALRVDVDGDRVDVVVGYNDASPAAAGIARFAPLLQDARGIAFDPIDLALMITEQSSGDIRRIGLDEDGDTIIDDPAAWSNSTLPNGVVGAAGIVYDAGSDTFVVAAEGAPSTCGAQRLPAA